MSESPLKIVLVVVLVLEPGFYLPKEPATRTTTRTSTSDHVFIYCGAANGGIIR
ncbi:MAG: hypothetical protein L0338_12090 [Acidobacteria bacterium]|nr:hypothetical protein [Acidobacteriota bacterium]